MVTTNIPTMATTYRIADIQGAPASPGAFPRSVAYADAVVRRGTADRHGTGSNRWSLARLSERNLDDTFPCLMVGLPGANAVPPYGKPILGKIEVS
jgi:hypothetical protein